MTCLEAFEFDELLNSINYKNFIIVVDVAYIPGVEPTIHINGGSRGIIII